MSESPSTGELDFERAQFDTPGSGGVTCNACQKPPGTEYFSVNGHSVCSSCLASLRAAQTGSFFKALLLGTAAGAAGAAGYYAITIALKGTHLALITIVLGIMVGVAVRRGAGGRRSVIYRLMAIALAWTAMCVTYVPMIADTLRKDDAQSGEHATPAAASDTAAQNDNQPLAGPALWIAASVLSLAVPFFFLVEMEVLGLLIFAFGLWEAWRRSAPSPFVVEGPFALGAAAPASAEPALPAASV